MSYHTPITRFAVALWLLSIIGIAGLSVFGRKIQLIVLGIIDQRWVAAIVFLFLFSALGIIWSALRDQRKKQVIWTIVLGLLLLGAGAIAVWQGVLQPVEAVHFLIFSWLGWISSSAFGPVWGLLALLAAACGDEILQYFLPDRVGDLHDVAINSVSGVVGLLLRGK